jgi:hypothetical protein
LTSLLWTDFRFWVGLFVRWKSLFVFTVIWSRGGVRYLAPSGIWQPPILLLKF